MAAPPDRAFLAYWPFPTPLTLLVADKQVYALHVTRVNLATVRRLELNRNGECERKRGDGDRVEATRPSTVVTTSALTVPFEGLANTLRTAVNPYIVERRLSSHPHALTLEVPASCIYWRSVRTGGWQVAGEPLLNEPVLLTVRAGR